MSEMDGVSAVDALEASIGTAPEGADGRGRLAAAIGLAASGHRTAVMLRGSDLVRSLDLLTEAARRRIPLVVHQVGGHDGYHAASTSGAVLFFATDAQDAVDLTVIAHRLAEDALLPVVVAMDGPETAFATHPVEVPDATALRRFLGRADDPIHPPTPSQALVFGKHRRRLVKWHDPERPLLCGAELGDTSFRDTVFRDTAFGAAEMARHAFFDVHVPDRLAAAAADFHDKIGPGPQPLRTFKTDGARYLLLVQGAAVETAEQAVRGLRSTGVAAGSVGLRTLRPLPSAALVELLRGRRGVVVLERLDAPMLAEGPLLAEVRTLLGQACERRRFRKVDSTLPGLREKDVPRLAAARYGLGDAPLDAGDVEEMVQRLARGHDAWHSPVYLGFATAGDAENGDYPQRQALRDALRRDYPALRDLGIRASRSDRSDRPSARLAGPGDMPPAVRRIGRSSAPLSDLPAFWNRTAVLYRDGRENELMPEPFLATRSVPPYTSALRDASAERSRSPSPALPVFDPEPCTGCGDCWTVCPDNAVEPALVDPSDLLELGLRRGKQSGADPVIEKLRMVSSKIAAQIEKQAKSGWDGGAAGPLFDSAVDAVMRKSKLPDGKKTDIRKAYGEVRPFLADVPVARTAPFFDDAPPSGPRLFALTLDPEACKGCGLCIAACEAGALTVARNGAYGNDALRDLRSLLDELPEPDEGTVEHARRHAGVGPLAGSLLPRQVRETMAGGHLAEVGSGEALALRQVLGATAYRLQSVGRRQLEDVRQLRTRLAERIHQTLAKALPDHDLDALARGLDALHDDAADLADLTTRIETAIDDERVDVNRTRRLVDAARTVANLEWRLESGEGGLGRSAMSLVIDGRALPWAVRFPFNPFRLPVTVDATGDAADLARGLADGHRRETVRIARVLRRARLELEGQAPGANQLEALDWNDLNAEERAYCPTVFLVTTDTGLCSNRLAGLEALLEATGPIRLLLLQNWAAEDDPSCLNCHLPTGRTATALFVQSSVAHDSHLDGVLESMLEHDGPAILRMLAPSPKLRGFAADETLEQARQWVERGAFALVPPHPDPFPPGGEGAKAVEPSPAAEVEPATVETIAELERRHAAELASLRSQFEARLAAERARYQSETAQRIRSRLMRLVETPREAHP